jgi:hypothetical protein
MSPNRVHLLRCEYCVHHFGNEQRCGLIQNDDGPVKPNDCCRYWFNPDVLAAENAETAPAGGAKAVLRRPTMRPPDLGRLLTKSEAAFAENVDESVEGCSDCQFFAAPRTCTLIGPDTVEAKGACSAFWRNAVKESEDERLYAEWKQPPPEADRGWLDRLKGWIARYLHD